MGLDMYLKRTIYISTYENLRPPGVAVTGLDELKIDNSHIKTITEEIGYWRKANAIHQWFVSNCGDGVDDCQDIDVSSENLRELLDTINKVLEVARLKPGRIHVGTTYDKSRRTEQYEEGEVIENPEDISELLPTQEGFFFGSTEYDSYYLKDLKHTKEILEKALALPDKWPHNDQHFVAVDFTYRASW